MHDGAAATLDRPAVELALNQLDSLPTLAPIAVRLIQATADAGSDAREVAALVRADQSLSAKLLSAANSPALGFRRNVTTVEQAVVTLGFARVRSLVLAVKVFECFEKASQTAAGTFNRAEFWKHSLAVACAARRLASEPTPPRGGLGPRLTASSRSMTSDVPAPNPPLGGVGSDPEEAFVAGLLHDIGKVALSAVFPKAYQRIATQADQARGEIADAERDALGIDHTLAGRRLADRWGLPDLYRDVIWLHHLPPGGLPTRIANPALIALVQLADALAREQRIGYSGNHVFHEPPADAAARLGFSRAEIETVAAHLAADVVQQSELLGLERTTSEAVYLRSLLRANQELGRANEELAARHQQLAAAERCFRAMAQLDAGLQPRASLGDVVAAIAHAGRVALQRATLAAIGLDEPQAAVESALASCGSSPCRLHAQPIPGELSEWLRAGGAGGMGRVCRAPLALRCTLAPAADRLGAGEPWMMPILYGGRFTGAIVFASARDEATELDSETDELRALCGSFGLAIARANATAAAARLADDLAEANARMQKMQTDVLRTRSLSMIAEMAAGAGHELNNPLSVISGRAQMLLRDDALDADARRSLEAICAKAHDCSGIVSDLMDFARPPTPHFEPIDLPALLAEVRDDWIAETALPASRLLIEFGSPDDSLRADRAQLKTVIAELLRNATEAVAETGGLIHVSWGFTSLLHPARGGQSPWAGLRGGPSPSAGARGAQPSPAGIAGRAIELQVRDSGRGIMLAVLQRVFDPFFSHRKAGRGRGLGLARAHRIIEAHEGRIWLESRPGEGTTAFVQLPAADAALNICTTGPA